MRFPVDEDGFLRRECPHCLRQFKWFHGETEQHPDELPPVEVYYCPYCGQPAALDAWWTQEQLEFARRNLAGPAHDYIKEAVGSAISGTRDSWISFEISGERPPSPGPLSEPDDMTMVTSPCHEYEPIKIDEEWYEEAHCLVCGAEFLLPEAL